MFLTRRPCTSCIRALTYSPRIPYCYRCLSTSSSSSSTPSTSSATSTASSNANAPSTAAHIPPHLTPSKYPIRGGQNLSSRYQRLENSVRSKVALETSKQVAVEVKDVAESSNPTTGSGSITPPSTLTKPKTALFHGLKIPEAPKPPESDECCMSGCAICVYDLHDDTLTAYKDSVTSLQASLDAMGVARDTWPASIRPPPLKSKAQAKAKFGALPPQQAQRAASLSAFEEMEMRLKAKQTPTPLPTEKVDLSSVVDPGRVLSEREIRSS